MGVVYEAFDREKDATVALKTLRRLEAQAVYRLKNEFRGLQGIEHPNLVSLGELVEDSGEWFFTMELVSGIDFLSYVRKETDPPAVEPQPYEETMTMDGVSNEVSSSSGAVLSADFDEIRLRKALRQLALGLTALHAAGKVHRDIKPSNVMVTDEGRVVLLDFGLVTEVKSDSQSTEVHAVGTAAYMSPEQAAAKHVGPASDWYSVGVMLYEALTGQRPFSGPALRVLQEKQVSEAVPPVSLVPDVPLDLDELCVKLLSYEPGDRPSEKEILEILGAADASPSQSGSTTDFTQSPPFVGRESERETLARTFAKVRDGAAVSVYVHGASGVGKSALLREFAEEAARTHGAVVLAGRCYERESVPFKALDGVVDALSHYMRRLRRAQAAELVPPNASMLPHIFPVLGRVEVIAEAPLPRRERKDPHERRRLVFAALRGLLWLLAERHPVVLVIDDLQWADNDSFLLLEDLVRPPDPPAMLLLISSREDPATLERARGSAGSGAPIPGELCTMRLGPLGKGDALELAERLVERAGLSRQADAGAIADEAEGHPLFIDELVRHAATAADVERERVRLDEAIWTRACKVPELARNVLHAICLANAPLPQELVRRAMKLDSSDFGRGISILRVANLARSKGTRDTDVVEPYHNRIREAGLAHLGEEERRPVHAQLAAALEGSDFAEKRPELLVVHFAAIGEARKAADSAVAAGERAAKALAFDRAVDLYRKAVELREREGEVPSALRAALGNALSMSGRRADAARVYLDSVSGALAGDALEYQRLAAESFIVSGHVDEGVSALRAVLEAVGLPFPPSGRRALISAMFRRAWLRIRGLGFKERDPTQISAEELRRIDVCWTASSSIGMIDTIRSVDYSTRHLSRALRAGERHRVVRGLALEICVRCTLSVRKARQSLELLETLRPMAGDDPYLVGWVHGAEGLTLYQLGQFQESRDASVESVRLFSECSVSTSYEQDSVRLWNLWARYYLGEVADLMTRVPRLLQDAEERGDLYMAANMCTGPPNAAWLFRDDIETARAQADARISRWSRQSYHLQHYWAFVARHQILLYAGEGETAWRSVNEGWPALASSWYLPIPMVGIESHDMRARCALAAIASGGDAERYAKLAERDARRTEKVGLPMAKALATLVRAGVAHVRGDDEAAEKLLADALERCEATNMHLIAAAARWRLGELRGGDEGTALTSRAEQWMRDEGIVSPARVTRMLAPGYEDSGA